MTRHMLSTPNIPSILSLCSLLFLLLNNITLVCGLYDGDKNVQTFESKTDFRSKVLESDSIWVVQFYAPWCGHCKQFSPQYSKLAELLKGIVPVGVVDSGTEDSKQKRIGTDYGVMGYPTIKIFGSDKANPVDVQSRDINEILKAIMTEVQTTINSRAGNGTNDSGERGSTESNNKKMPSHVVQLTDSNFKEKVYDNPEVALIAFIAPWCGHCKALMPEWALASTKLGGSGAFLGVVDATAQTSLAQEFQVQGYPTIKVFPGGEGKTAASAMNYEGPRDVTDIVQAALAEVDRSGVPKEIPELTGAEMMEESCQGPNKICVFFALPHILDTGADGRNKYKDTMGAASKAVRGMNFVFFWFEGTSQPDLENTLELTFGFPSVAAYSADKGVYTVHRGSFSELNIRRFLTGITTGKQQTYKLSAVPKVETVEPWDGKDGVPYVDEPLDDIMGWDDDDEF